MIWKHGTFEHPVRLRSIASSPRWKHDGTIIETVKTAVIEGKVTGTSQDAIRTAGNALEAAYLDAQVFKTGLRHDDDSDSIHTIDISGQTTKSGITASIVWLDDLAAYVTYRRYRIFLEATIYGGGSTVLRYSNQITFVGDGGPTKVARPTLSGVVIQQPYPASAFRAFESGFKISRTGNVIAKPPSYPNFLVHENKSITDGVERTEDGQIWMAGWNYAYVSTAGF